MRCLFIKRGFASLILVYASVNANGLNVAVGSDAIRVDGITRSGSVVLFSCSRSNRFRSIAVQPSAVVLSDDDADGAVQYVPVSGISSRSVCIAVDTATGAYKAQAAADFPMTVSEISDDAFKKDVEGEIATLAADLPRLSLLLVRPGAGAWVLTAFDGESTDADAHGDGRIQLAFDGAATLSGKDKAPKHLKKGDTVVAIDPGHLDVFATTIQK